MPWIPSLQLGPRSASPTYSDLANEPLCKQVMSWNPKHRRFLCLISKPLLRGHTRSRLFCAPVTHRVTQKQQDARNERLAASAAGFLAVLQHGRRCHMGEDGPRLNSNSWRTGINPFMRVESHDLRSVGWGGGHSQIEAALTTA